MLMKQKNLLTASLAVLLLLSVFSGCGNDGKAPAQTSDVSEAPESLTTETQDPRLAVSDDLPERDYGGEVFMILTHSPTYYFVEEENGDVLNDAYFKRQNLVEERFNVDIQSYNGGGISENVTVLTNSVLAGDDAYALTVIHSITGAPPLITDHVVLDWNEIPGIDLSKPWWNQQINTTLNIAEKQFYIAGYITNPSPFCMFYNPALGQQFDFEEIYTVVREGRWTVDYLTELCQQVSADLNGDGKMDFESDRYGVGFNNDNQTLNYMYASNMVSVLIDENGQPVPNVNNEKMQKLADKIWHLANEDDLAIYTDYDGEGAGHIAFNEGRLLVRAGSIDHAISMRGSEVDFQVIPYPKYDEAQEGYYTHVDAWNGILCVGKSVKDPERSGIITEAFAAETWKHVIPVYYETALSDKYFRDEDSVEMMNLIYDGIVYDFGYVFDDWNGTTWMLVNLTKSKSPNLASAWKKVEKRVNKHYENLYKAVLEDE